MRLNPVSPLKQNEHSHLCLLSLLQAAQLFLHALEGCGVSTTLPSVPLRSREAEVHQNETGVAVMRMTFDRFTKELVLRHFRHEPVQAVFSQFMNLQMCILTRHYSVQLCSQLGFCHHLQQLPKQFIFPSIHYLLIPC